MPANALWHGTEANALLEGHEGLVDGSALFAPRRVMRRTVAVAFTSCQVNQGDVAQGLIRRGLESAGTAA